MGGQERAQNSDRYFENIDRMRLVEINMVNYVIHISAKVFEIAQNNKGVKGVNQRQWIISEK